MAMRPAAPPPAPRPSPPMLRGSAGVPSRGYAGALQRAIEHRGLEAQGAIGRRGFDWYAGALQRAIEHRGLEAQGAIGRRGFDWESAAQYPGLTGFAPWNLSDSLQYGPYSGGAYYGPGYGYGYGSGSGAVEVIDVYDDDGDADMGCETSQPTALPVNTGLGIGTVIPSAGTLSKKTYGDKSSQAGTKLDASDRTPTGDATGANLGHEADVFFGFDPWEKWGGQGDRSWWDRRRPGAPRRRPDAPEGYNPLVYWDRRRPGAPRRRPDAPEGYNPLVYFDTHPIRFNGDASFGWMMPTLPGAISESPLRGVFAPDEGLGQKMSLGDLG
jgi:hypothetical protein